MAIRMNTRAGFTLLELLVVIAIIAILASIMFPVFASLKKKAQIQKASADTKTIATAVRAYHTEYGEWPVLPAGGVWSNNNYVVLQVLISPGNVKAINFMETTNWNASAGPLLDPFKWKFPYVIMIDADSNSVTVVSAGPNGVYEAGANDDIKVTQ